MTLVFLCLFRITIIVDLNEIGLNRKGGVSTYRSYEAEILFVCISIIIMLLRSNNNIAPTERDYAYPNTYFTPLGFLFYFLFFFYKCVTPMGLKHLRSLPRTEFEKKRKILVLGSFSFSLCLTPVPKP